jgi:sulfatase maturation enzyme AslB (radical SAM superfamily)
MFENISQTAKNNLQINKISNTHIEYWMEQIDDYIQNRPDNSVILKLFGGEPLMQIANLQNLLKLHCNKIKKIEICTNLNPPDNKFLLWLLQNIDTEKIRMIVSLDACPDYNHIPRAGFDQKKFQDNLKLLISHNVNFKFSAVMSVLGIFDIANYIKWAGKNNFEVVFNSINNPDCLDPKYIPQQFLQPIIEQFGDHTSPVLFSDLFKIEQSEVGLKLFEQYNYLTQYFSRTNTNPEKINNQFFQDYWNWLTNKVKNENSIGI